jgi:hypothetical protein
VQALANGAVMGPVIAKESASVLVIRHSGRFDKLKALNLPKVSSFPKSRARLQKTDLRGD